MRYNVVTGVVTSRCTFFFFNDTATTEIYTLSLHDALPICEFLPPAVSPGRRPLSPYLHPNSARYRSSSSCPADSLFRVRAFQGERYPRSKGSVLLYSGHMPPSSMVAADTSVGSKDAVSKPGSHHHG